MCKCSAISLFLVQASAENILQHSTSRRKYMRTLTSLPQCHYAPFRRFLLTYKSHFIFLWQKKKKNTRKREKMKKFRAFGVLYEWTRHTSQLVSYHFNTIRARLWPGQGKPGFPISRNFILYGISFLWKMKGLFWLVECGSLIYLSFELLPT